MRIIVIHSLKFGGVGKTVISHALALRLVEDYNIPVLYITSEPALARYYDVPNIAEDIYNVRIIRDRLLIAYSDNYDISSVLPHVEKLCHVIRDILEIEYAILDMPAGYIPHREGQDYTHILVMKPLEPHASQVKPFLNPRTILVINMVRDRKLVKDRKKLLEKLSLDMVNIREVFTIEYIKHNAKKIEEEHHMLAHKLARKDEIKRLAKTIRELV